MLMQHACHWHDVTIGRLITNGRRLVTGPCILCISLLDMLICIHTPAMQDLRRFLRHFSDSNPTSPDCDVNDEAPLHTIPCSLPMLTGPGLRWAHSPLMGCCCRASPIPARKTCHDCEMLSHECFETICPHRFVGIAMVAINSNVSRRRHCHYDACCLCF